MASNLQTGASAHSNTSSYFSPTAQQQCASDTVDLTHFIHTKGHSAGIPSISAILQGHHKRLTTPSKSHPEPTRRNIRGRHNALCLQWISARPATRTSSSRSGDPTIPASPILECAHEKSTLLTLLKTTFKKRSHLIPDSQLTINDQPFPNDPHLRILDLTIPTSIPTS